MRINIKKSLVLLLMVMAFFFNSLSAQEGSHEKGVHHVGPGLGLYWSGVGIFGQYDYGLHKNWSIGAMLGAMYPGQILYVSLRGDFHLGKFVKLPSSMDWYAGLHGGLNFVRGVYGHVAVHSGIRYFFSGKNIGIQAEAMGGFNMAGIHVAAIWKLGKGGK